MKQSILYIIILLLGSVMRVNAQADYINEIRFEQLSVVKGNNNTIIRLNINLDSLHTKTTEMITLTPVIKSKDSLIVKNFDPIVITGNNRSKVLNRSLQLNNFQFDVAPQQVVKHRNNHAQTIPLVLQLPYGEWQHSAELVIYENVTGCACEKEGKNSIILLTPVYPPVYKPVYNVCYITPPVEEVKARSEKYAAHLNFKVAKYDLLYDFGENARILNEVDAIINEVRNDPNLTVTEFSITGYASPEGNYNSNMTLSKNRAYAFVNYLQNKYGIAPAMLKTSWKGEDWEGLRNMIDSSFIADRSNIVNVIDNNDNVDKRKSGLKKLSGGQTYKILLAEYYPFLRRNEYVISYIVRPFSVEEAKEIIKTKPQQLSQNEMFMVAGTYPKNSPEFKEVFNVISRYYPDNPVVKANNAAVELGFGNPDNAIRELSTISGDMPEIWNNLGYAYIKKGEYKKAEEYFRKAADAKLNCAADNLTEYQKWKESSPDQ